MVFIHRLIVLSYRDRMDRADHVKGFSQHINGHVIVLFLTWTVLIRHVECWRYNAFWRALYGVGRIYCLLFIECASRRQT